MTTAILAGQLAVLLLAAIFAGRQVREIRRTREEESRPFVVVDFEQKRGLFYLVVTNIGRTMAREVSFSFDPELASSLDDRNRKEQWSIATLKLLRDGIQTLPPNKRIVTLFDTSFGRDRDRYPDVYDVAVSYGDANGRRRFDDHMTLDLGVYYGLLRVEKKDAHDIHKRLEELVREVKRWSASGGGLSVLTPADVRKRWEDRDEVRRARKSDAA
jgi:hypothetical protein